MANSINQVINNLPYVVQNSYGAAATLIGANIVFAETALRITMLMDNFFDKQLKSLPDWAKNGVEITVMASTIAGLNVALNQLLKMPFNPWVTAGISSVTAMGYLVARLCSSESQV